MSIRYALVGYARLTFAMADMAGVLNLCMLHRLAYCRFSACDAQGTAGFEMPTPRAVFFLRLCERAGIQPCSVKWGGFPHFFALYRRRVGLALGFLLGILLVIQSCHVVWDIRVEGNETLTKRQVLAELERGGIRVGMSFDELDRHETEMRILLNSDLLSWLSINMVGTVAYVEIREKVPLPEEKEALLPANMVAETEGVIERLEIYTGMPVTAAGQRVKKGDLLISGLYDSQSQGYRVTRAAGQVIARTSHTFSVEIPFDTEQKCYTGEKKVQRTLIFFGKEIKLFKNSGIPGQSCDKIDTVDSFTPKEGVTLPIALKSETFLPFRVEPSRRTPDMVRALAYDALNRLIEQELPEAELLSKTVVSTLTDAGLRLDCTLICLENIARVKEFSVVDLPGR